MKTFTPSAPREMSPEARSRIDALLDEALAATFPSSDPFSVRVAAVIDELAAQRRPDGP